MKRIIIFILLLISISNANALEKVKLYKCVDGDTFRIKINDVDIKVRMLAIDTPESVKEKVLEYYGKEASAYTCNKLTKAKKIELEYDPNSDKYDKYGRLLAWVFVDDELLQNLLVKNGYAKVAYLYNDYKYIDLLKESQEKASIKELGVWNSKEANKFNPSTSEEDSTDKITTIELIILVITFLLMALFGRKKK